MRKAMRNPWERRDYGLASRYFTRRDPITGAALEAVDTDCAYREPSTEQPR